MHRIFLIGYMGAGKTTLGRALAVQMNLSFIDLDWYIEQRYRKTINEIFNERGDAGFRDVERMILHEVCEIENVIIATGGGTPCFFDNLDYMKQHGVTVYLQVSDDKLLKRLKLAKHTRPLLKRKNDNELKDYIVTNLKLREPFYVKADYTFKADEIDHADVIPEITLRLYRLITSI